MATATLVHTPAAPAPKLDPADFDPRDLARRLRQARRMVRDRRTMTAATAWGWYLDAARKRFGASGWRIAQAAGRVVFDARTVVHARAGSLAELERQGLVRRIRRPRRGNLTATVPYRCASFERLREHGLSMAWSFDPLASSANKGLRAYRAQRRREVARIMAEDRAAMERSRFGLTVVGVLALREAEAARATA